MTANAICINCETELTGKYCSGCGQKSHTGRLTLHELFHEVWHALTHTDKGILRLIKDLAIHPAQVYQGYLKGQRKKYFSPVLFFLVTAGLLAFFYPYVFEYQDKMFNTHNEFGKALYHLTKYRALVLLPVQVLLTWAFFHKRYNLAEVTVFWLFCMGFVFTVKLVSVPFYFPLIRYKSELDSILIYIGYIIMFWHASLILGRSRMENILLFFVLVNIFYLLDGLLQFYIIFGTKMFQTNPYGVHNLWDYIKLAYTVF